MVGMLICCYRQCELFRCQSAKRETRIFKESLRGEPGIPTLDAEAEVTVFMVQSCPPNLRESTFSANHACTSIYVYRYVIHRS